MKITQPHNANYAATVIKIVNTIVLPNCDNVVHTTIMGNQVVVSKDITIGEIGLFFPVETRLSDAFLKNNNLYKHSEKNLDQTKKGYFEDNGRIRCVKFRGHASEGLYMPIDSLAFILPPDPKKGYGGIGLSDMFSLGDTFDSLEGVAICEKYIVVRREQGTPNSKKPRNPKVSKLVDNQFKFHNDTAKLYNNLHMLSPNDLISITYKIHGTSFISSNVLCNKPLKWYEKALKKLGINIVDKVYDNIYASRKVVKNEELNPNAQHFYEEDIWGIANAEVKPFLLEGMTVYGEVAGFLVNGSYIQKGFDYGCEPNQHKLFIYRVTYTNPSGKVFEFSMKQVQDWCALNGLQAVPLLYYGYAKDFYGALTVPSIEQWREEFLAYVKSKYNEKDCYLCANKVPQEGCVLRIERLGLEAYKVKSTRFLEYETKNLDTGEIDIEEEN